MTDILSIIVGIIILGLIIIIHETGHFIFSKIFNVKVLKFSIGFGPVIARKKIGETEFLVSSIPLGGYVSPLDEERIEEIKRAKEKMIQDLQSKGSYDLLSTTKVVNETIEQKFGITQNDMIYRTFESKPYLAKILIVLGGPLFNILFGIFAMYLLLIMGIEKLGNTVGDILKDSPAEKVGIAKGDIITEINGVKTKTWDEIKLNIITSKDKVKLKVLRNGNELEFEVIPQKSGKSGKIIGISPDTSQIVKIKYNPIEAIPQSFKETYNFISMFLRSFKILLSKEGIESIGGPIALTKITSEAAQSGIKTLLIVVFFISINLGILNLLPIPVLDGGHIFIMSLEKLARRKFSPKVKQAISFAGIIILSALLIVAMFNDIKNIVMKRM